MKEKQQNKYTKAVILILNSSKIHRKTIAKYVDSQRSEKRERKKKNETMNEQTKQKNI